MGQPGRAGAGLLRAGPHHSPTVMHYTGGLYVAKTALRIHDELETEIEEVEAEVAPLKAAMLEATKAFDDINNKLTALKKARREMLNAPGVAVAVEQRGPKK